MAQHQFKAIDAGTLSNPYRWVEKGEIVLLNDEQAEFYLKRSKWLRPLAEVNARKEQPLMPHMKLSGQNGLPYSKPQPLAPSPMTQGYEKSMASIKQREDAEDGIIRSPVEAHTAPAQPGPVPVLPPGAELGKPGDGAEQQGTGNLDPLAG